MGNSIGTAHDPSVAEIPRFARDRRRHLPALRARRKSTRRRVCPVVDYARDDEAL